ncbi:MAG: response regulator transcription factor [Candidatus Hydrogenedentes bacterium]|nr:response regulator transcription factor [Candidatus Hydrogenedentota bacterium]
MIYIVDEDVMQLGTLQTELEIRGHTVYIIPDADTAYSVLDQIGDDLELVLIDVMLAASADRLKSRFTRERTDDFMKTGLCLLDDLATVNPNQFPRKAVFFSYASNPNLLKAVDASAKKHNVIHLKKSDYASDLELGVVIEKLIEHATHHAGGTGT